MILHYSLEVERNGTGCAREKAALYDKLGDLCCVVKAYAPAVKFYGKQVGWEDSHYLEVLLYTSFFGPTDG